MNTTQRLSAGDATGERCHSRGRFRHIIKHIIHTISTTQTYTPCKHTDTYTSLSLPHNTHTPLSLKHTNIHTATNTHTHTHTQTLSCPHMHRERVCVSPLPGVQLQLCEGGLTPPRPADWRGREAVITPST